MAEAVWAGLVTGWAIAVPVGAVGAFLVTLTARTSFRVGAGAALGIAAVDGAYAAAAAVGGTALAAVLSPVAGSLRVVSAVVLLLVAALTAAHALRPSVPDRRPWERARAVTPGRAFVLFVGLTAVNPTTVVYFVAVVTGNPHLVPGPAAAVLFVLCAWGASASWQLLLAGGGAGLGRAVAGPRGRTLTGLVSAAVIAALAVRTVLA